MFREMRRFKQQIPQEECIKILTETKRGTLAMNGDGGYPFNKPINFFYEDGKIYFHGAMAGYTFDSIKRDNRVSFCAYDDGVLDETGYFYYVNSVICFGRMNIIEDEEKRLEYMWKLGGKYFPNDDFTREEIKMAAARAVMYEFDIEHMTGKHVHEQ